MFLNPLEVIAARSLGVDPPRSNVRVRVIVESTPPLQGAAGLQIPAGISEHEIYDVDAADFISMLETRVTPALLATAREKYSAALRTWTQGKGTTQGKPADQFPGSIEKFVTAELPEDGSKAIMPFTSVSFESLDREPLTWNPERRRLEPATVKKPKKTEETKS